MTGAQIDLFGAEAGERVERVEWGLRYPRGAYLAPPGGIDPRPSEENARAVSDDVYKGTRGTVVVRRVVVTYTTPWEAAQ